MFHDRIRRQLLDQLQLPAKSEVDELNEALRLLAKWRSVLIQNTVLQRTGTTVWQGPLKGLDFLAHSGGLPHCEATWLLRTAATAIDRACHLSRYELILNNGCAEGYYAVGWRGAWSM